MQEILFKTIDPNASLLGQEFYELRLFEERHSLGTRHGVLQIHAQCSDLTRGAVWEGEEIDYFWIPEEAETRYAERRQALAERGFIYSDMDPIL